MPNEVVNWTENLYDWKIDSPDWLKDLLKANWIESDDDRTKVSELIKTKVEDEINRRKDESETSDEYKKRASWSNWGMELIKLEEHATLQAINDFKKTKASVGDVVTSQGSVVNSDLWEWIVDVGRQKSNVETVENSINVSNLKSVIDDIKKTWENNESMNWFIEKESMDALNNFETQCFSIIDNFNRDVNDGEKAAQAILSLLVINQVLWKVKLENKWVDWWSVLDFDLQKDCYNQLIDFIWMDKIDFSALLWDELHWKSVSDAVDKIFDSYRESKLSVEDKHNKEKHNRLEKFKADNKIKWKWAEDHELWDGEIVENDDEKDAITYLEELIKSHDTGNVSTSFVKLRDYLNSNADEKETFQKYVFELIDICCPSLKDTDTESLDSPEDWNGTGYSDQLSDKFESEKVRAFQNFVKSNASKWWEFGEAWTKLCNGISDEKKVVDWKLWRNTLQCLMEFVKAWLEFKEPEFEQGWKWKIEKWDNDSEKKETWTELERMPLTFTSFMQFWTLSEEWGFKVFKFKDNPWESDFVKKELWTDKKYVEISGKKFYIEWWDQWEPQFRNIPVVHKWRDSDWNIIPIKTTELCFWTFDESWKLVNWSKVIIDSEWKQISSLIMTEIKDKDWNIINLWVKTMWWKEKTITQDGKPVDKQVVKRRIDVFGKEWNDTKEMSDEQINTILANPEACKVVLDLAINAYKETMHRPSHVWRYNLNHIIDGLLLKFSKDGDISDKLLKLDWKGYRWYFDEWLSADDRVCRFLWLSEWLRSNPENKINKTDLSVAQMNEFDARGKASERKEYRSGLKQYERIVGRLWLLKDILDKKDLNPETWLWEKQKPIGFVDDMTLPKNWESLNVDKPDIA